MKKIAIGIFFISLLGANEVGPLGKGGGYLNYKDNKSEETINDKDILLKILEEEKKQTAIQKEILEIIKKTSGIPQEVVVNGKKCLANSSADCFVMPLANDALKIPVMGRWIQNPTVENAIEFYKWQTKLLNQSIDAGYSLNFASLSMQNPFYGHQIQMQTGGNDSLDQIREIIDSNIKKYAKNMELKIMLGKNNFDLNSTTRIFDIYDNLKALGLRVKFVFEDEKALNDFANFHYKAPNENYQKNWKKLPKEDKIISPNSFKSNDIYITPLYILSYLDIKNNKSFNQVVGGGYEKIEEIKNRIKNALLLFKISKPQDFNTQRNSNTPLEFNLKYLDKNNPKTKEFEEFLKQKIQEGEKK